MPSEVTRPKYETGPIKHLDQPEARPHPNQGKTHSDNQPGRSQQCEQWANSDKVELFECSSACTILPPPAHTCAVRFHFSDSRQHSEGYMN
jgi:hypothetical protein